MTNRNLPVLVTRPAVTVPWVSSDSKSEDDENTVFSWLSS